MFNSLEKETVFYKSIKSQNEIRLSLFELFLSLLTMHCVAVCIFSLEKQTQMETTWVTGLPTKDSNFFYLISTLTQSKWIPFEEYSHITKMCKPQAHVFPNVMFFIIFTCDVYFVY